MCDGACAGLYLVGWRPVADLRVRDCQGRRGGDVDAHAAFHVICKAVVDVILQDDG
jgi:hypothetical protein